MKWVHFPEKFEDKVMYHNNYILREEIKILNPNAVVFVTGPNYDMFIKKTFQDICFEQVKTFDINEIAILKHKELPNKSIRVYHPGYQNRLGGRKYMVELSNDIIDCFSKIN